MTLWLHRVRHGLILGSVCLVAIACQSQPAEIKPVPTPAASPTLEYGAAANPLSTPISPATPTLVVSPTPEIARASTDSPNLSVQVAPTPTATPTAVAEKTLFDALIAPFASEASKRRAARAKSDPEYSKRVDAVLNAGRVNFLLFGYGETHEPPVTEREIIGSQTIVSYDLGTRKADLVSLTHDIRAPEIERAFWKPGQRYHALRIDQAYNIGGFNLMRTTLEDATGLAVDFQVTFRDRAIQSLVDDVFGGVEVQVPVEFRTQPFYLDGKKYDKGYFPKGVQRMDGKRVIQFIKTVPITEGYYGKPLEHNVRKHLVFTALLESVRRNYKERKFWLGGTAFLMKQLTTGAIVYDFDPLTLMVNNIGETAMSIEKIAAAQTGDLEMPTIGATLYIVDPAHGDGGVTWVAGEAAVNPIAKKDIEARVYPHLAYEVPCNANPYGDLVTEYWQSVRRVVRNALLPAQPSQDAQAE